MAGHTPGGLRRRGSHSGAYLPGDYLVTVEPPALARLAGVLRRLSRLLLPWTRGHPGTGFGIPFIDYHRGDGPGVGPDEQRAWRPVLVDDRRPGCATTGGCGGWNPEYRSAASVPAGPRYERGGSVRSCWSDPVGWAGLDKEAPSPQAEQQVIKDRIIELDDQLSAAAEELGVRGDQLRRARAGLRALGSSRISGDPAPLARLETVVGQIRQRRQMLAAEREALVRASAHGLPRSPHAHLRHRAVPNVAPARRRNRVLRAWSAASASLLLAGLAVIVAGHAGALLPALGGLAVFMLGAEAFANVTSCGSPPGLSPPSPRPCWHGRLSSRP